MSDVNQRELSERVWSVAEACLDLANQDGVGGEVRRAAEHLLNALDILSGSHPDAWRDELMVARA